MSHKLNYIVFLRVLCTVCVLVNHVPLVASHVFSQEVTTKDVMITTIANYLVHFAVPVFVMITGALLLNTQKDVSIKKSLCKYAWRMVVVLLSVGTFYAMMENYSTKGLLSFEMVIDSVCMVFSGNTWTHMWYLYMLIGLYFFIPFLKLIINNTSYKNVWIFTLILFVFTSALPAAYFCGVPKFGVNFPINSQYVLYLLLGWLLSQTSLRDVAKKKIVLVIMVILTIALVAIAANDVLYYNGNLKFWEAYNSPLIVLFSMCVFLLSFWDDNKMSAFCNNVAVKLLNRNSFGIYVFHMLWLNILYKVVRFNPFAHGVIYLFFVLVGTLLLSIATTELYRKIPYLGKHI